MNWFHALALAAAAIYNPGLEIAPLQVVWGDLAALTSYYRWETRHDNFVADTVFPVIHS